MIGDAMPIQNTAFDASRLFADLFFSSVCCSLRAAVFPGNERDWRCLANPEDTMLTSAEVTDLMLELLLHMTRETVRLEVCRLHGQLPYWSGSTS